MKGLSQIGLAVNGLTIKALFRFKVLAILSSLVLVACIGTSKVPVLYIAPDTSTVYTTATLSPIVEFPNGVPSPGDVEVRINGLDVTSEFDLWDDGGNDRIAISGRVDDGSYPLMLAALREGANTFQVTKPSKSIMYFTVDIGGANVHITEVLDSYCGNAFIDTVGSSADLADNEIENFDCSGFVKRVCPHPTYYTYTDNIGVAHYSSPFVNECEFAQGTGPAVPAYNTTNKDSGGQKYMYIRGYFESESVLDTLTIKSYDIDNNGTWFEQESRDRAQGVFLDEGDISTAFGVEGASCNGQTVDLAFNEFCVTFPDRDGVRIGGTDANGYSYREWLRSDIPQSDSRLKNGGVFALRGEVTALTEILDAVAKSLSTNDDLVTGTEYLVNPADPPPGFCLFCDQMSMTLTELFLREFKMTSDFPTPGSSNGRGGTWPSGQLNLFIDLNSQSGWGVELAGAIDVTCPTFWGIPNPICAVFYGIEGPYTVGLDVSTTAEVDISLDGSHEMHTVTALQAFDIHGIDLNMSGWLGGLIDFITPIIINMIEGMIGDSVGNAVEALVNAVFNKDLPLMRFVLPSVNTEAEATKIFMALTPEMAEFTTNTNVYDDEVAGELAFGLHATGKPRINKSIGSLYDSAAPISLFQVTTAREDDTLNYSDRNVGMVLHESFVNQLMMGMWEAGILYIDFNAGNDPLVNTFVDNANIKFGSASPWTISHLADITLGDGTKENARGDVKLDVDDLVIHFSGDVFDPFEQKWYYDMLFFELVIELEAYADLVAENGAFKVVFSSNPTVEMLAFNSDYIPLDETLGNALLQQAMPMLVTEVGSFEFPLPKLLGINLEVGDVWIPDTANLALTLDAFYEGPSYREYINRESGKCLTLDGGTSNGVNIVVRDCVDTDGQKWGLDPLTGFIHSFVNADFCMAYPDGNPGNGRNLELWDCSISHPFAFNENMIRSARLRTQVADANGSSEGSNVSFWGEHGGDNQLWDLGKEGIVYHVLVETQMGKCLNVPSVASGQSLQIDACDGSTSQNWGYERSEGLIHAEQNPNLCVDFGGPGLDAVLVDCASAPSFIWKGGVFRSEEYPDQVLTAQGYLDGENVNVDTRVGAARYQEWDKELKPLNYKQFVNDESGLCLDLPGQVSTCNDGSAFNLDLSGATFTDINGYANPTYGALSTLVNGVYENGGSSMHYMKSGSPTGDWGFSLDLGSSNNVTQVNLDGRDDCCQNRLDGVMIRLYESGGLVYSSGVLSGAGSGANLFSVPGITADELRIVVPNGNDTGGGCCINFSEIIVQVNNTDAQLWAVNAYNGSIHNKADPTQCLSYLGGLSAGTDIGMGACTPFGNNFNFINETITSLEDMTLVAAENGASEGSNVQFALGDGSRAQTWTKGKRVRIYNELISRQSGRCIDLSGSNVIDGEQIQVYDCNGGHKWGLDYYSGQMHYESNPAYCLGYNGGVSENNSVKLRLCTNIPNQTWEYVNNELVVEGTSYALQARGMYNGNDIQIATTNSGNFYHLWKEGRYVWGDLKVQNGGTPVCMDNKGGGSPYNGQWLIGYGCHGGDNQKYAYDLVTKQWHNKGNPAYCVSYESNSGAINEWVMLWECTRSYSYFDYVNGPITSVNTPGAAIEISNWSTGDGSNWLQMRATDGGNDQTWVWESE